MVRRSAWEDPNTDSAQFGGIIESTTPANADEYDVVLVGEPFDRGSVGRPGAREGPAGIRAALADVETHHLDAGPVESVGDIGAIEIPAGASVPTAQETVREAVDELHDAKTVPVILGGDGSLTYANVVGLLEATTATDGGYVTDGGERTDGPRASSELRSDGGFGDDEESVGDVEHFDPTTADEEDDSGAGEADGDDADETDAGAETDGESEEVDETEVDDEDDETVDSDDDEQTEEADGDDEQEVDAESEEEVDGDDDEQEADEDSEEAEADDEDGDSEDEEQTDEGEGQEADEETEEEVGGDDEQEADEETEQEVDKEDEQEAGEESDEDEQEGEEEVDEESDEDEQEGEEEVDEESDEDEQEGEEEVDEDEGSAVNDTAFSMPDNETETAVIEESVGVTGSESESTDPETADSTAATGSVGVISLDARLDCRAVDGEPTNRNAYRELFEAGLDSLAVLGARHFESSTAEAEFLREQGGTVVTAEEVADDPVEAADRALGAMDDIEQLYVSIDLSVLDATAAPGVSAPAPGGLSSRELFRVVRLLASDDRVAGVELVETAPALDRDDRTVDAAARAVAHAVASLSN